MLLLHQLKKWWKLQHVKESLLFWKRMKPFLSHWIWNFITYLMVLIWLWVLSQKNRVDSWGQWCNFLLFCFGPVCPLYCLHILLFMFSVSFSLHLEWNLGCPCWYMVFYLYRQYGVRESKDVMIEGRVQFDLLQVLFKNLFCIEKLLHLNVTNLFFNHMPWWCRLCKGTTN